MEYNAIESAMTRETCRRARVVGTFSDAGLCKAAPCGGYPVRQQKVHEHETLGGSARLSSIAG